MLLLRDFMTTDVATLAPEDTLRDAINMLSERCITGAPVVSGDEVCGVISVMDIMDCASLARPVDAGSAPADWEAGEDLDASSYYYAGAVDESGPLVEYTDEQHDILEDHTVGEAMTRTLLMLPPDTEAHAAAAFMIERGVHRLLVAADGRLDGLVTTTDFLRLIADRRL